MKSKRPIFRRMYSILAKCLYYGKIHFYKKVVLFYLGVDTGKVLWIDFLRPKPQSYDRNLYRPSDNLKPLF